MGKKKPGYELIDRDERTVVLSVIDSAGSMPFKYGFDKLRNGRYSVWEFKQYFLKK